VHENLKIDVDLLARRPVSWAIRTLRGWAIHVLQEAGAIQECEEHGWAQDRADPHARERAFDLAYPDIKVEVIIDYGLTDIVAEGYDSGVRLGEQVAKNMIAVRIGPTMRVAIVASPQYFERYPVPETPQDLTVHNCINMRLPTYCGLFPWGLERDGREVNVRGEGQLVFNNLGMRINSALDGLGVAYVPEDQASPHIASGHLIRVLKDWCPSFPGYHLYYTSRRYASPAFAQLVDVLRYRGA
jgi:DNA-binding transcriptional LysR family regulator